MSTNPNDAKNVIATFFGLMAEGTSRFFDMFTTAIVFIVIAGVISNALSAEAQQTLTGAAITFIPAVLACMWWYKRVTADNRARKALKHAPDNMTVKQIRDAVTVQDAV